ncbi:MAG TPA: hypothetical protein VK801_14550 [Caulobacteraceae bacterium]|nr:hypothetical protein [Caulobacteraceae bacterium]
MDLDTAASGGMEGKGAYNRNAQLPARGAAMATPLLEAASREIALDLEGGPIVVADYGCSQGRNSFAPMRAVIHILRQRLGPDQPILVCHEDLPVNDFNSLFDVLAHDPESYAAGDANLFPCAIGRSFYEQVLPASYVNLGWSSYAAMWVSHIPAPLPGRIIALGATGEVRAIFDRQAADDWRRFLSLRAHELRPGGALVVAVPGYDEAGLSGFESIMDDATGVLADMVVEGHVTAQERERMVIGAWPRSRAELLEPFAAGQAFQGLRATACETFPLEDGAWAEWRIDNDLAALASKQALFYRSIFAPSLAMALEGDADRAADFSARLEDGVRRRRSRASLPINSFVSVIAITKAEGD